MTTEPTPKYGTIPDQYPADGAMTWYEFSTARDANYVYTLLAKSDKIAIATLFLFSTHRFWAIHRPRLTLDIPVNNYDAMFGNIGTFCAANLDEINIAIGSAQIGSIEEREALTETLMALFGTGADDAAADYIDKWCEKRAPKGRIDVIRPLILETKRIFL